MNILLLPGQGTQKAGMFYQGMHSTKYQDIFRKASCYSRYDLIKLCSLSSLEALTQSGFLQAVITTHNYGLSTALDLSEFDQIAGYSLGEISACVISGVISFEDAIHLVLKRETLMKSACHDGGMLLVSGLSEYELEKYLINSVSISIYIDQHSHVISGKNVDLFELEEKLSIDARVHRVNVSGPFHSPLMSPITNDYKKLIDDISFKDANIPIILNSNVVSTDKDEIKRSLISQIESPVYWHQSLKHLIEDTSVNFKCIDDSAYIIKNIEKYRSTLLSCAV